MRSLEEIQGGNRQAAVNERIDRIRAEVASFAGRTSTIETTAERALELSENKLSNATRQQLNAALYAVLINFVGSAKATGWNVEQYAAGERLIEEIEHEATGQSLNGGVPVGYSVPVVLPAAEPVADTEVAADTEVIEPKTTTKGAKK